jgi:methylated-DNA-protein-cysteine methyltransferase-like protein
LTEEIIDIIKSIPRGKVATYGQIAKLAGYNNGARLVVRILHSCSVKYDLAWYRVVNAKGEIALPLQGGAEEQKALLLKEGVSFVSEYKVDMAKHLWMGS